MKTITIRYCEVWNYRPRAARAAALINSAIGLKSALVPGKRGEFSVWVGNERVAAKDSTGFPTEQDVLAAVQRALGKSWLVIAS